MLDASGRTRDIERLRTLLDRLGSSEITLAEAKDLRESVLAMVAERAPVSAIPGKADAPVFAGRAASARAILPWRARS